MIHALLAQADVGELATTGGSILAGIGLLTIKDWFKEKLVTKREDSKIDNLTAQTQLLNQILDVKKKGIKKSVKEHRKTQKLLREVLAKECPKVLVLLGILSSLSASAQGLNTNTIQFYGTFILSNNCLFASISNMVVTTTTNVIQIRSAGVAGVSSTYSNFWWNITNNSSAYASNNAGYQIIGPTATGSGGAPFSIVNASRSTIYYLSYDAINWVSANQAYNPPPSGAYFYGVTNPIAYSVILSNLAANPTSP